MYRCFSCSTSGGFDQFKLERLAGTESKPPKGDGAIIFDEVKVVCRLMWNCRSNEIIGLAMSPDELPTLSDV